MGRARLSKHGPADEVMALYAVSATRHSVQLAALHSSKPAPPEPGPARPTLSVCLTVRLMDPLTSLSSSASGCNIHGSTPEVVALLVVTVARSSHPSFAVTKDIRG